MFTIKTLIFFHLWSQKTQQSCLQTWSKQWSCWSQCSTVTPPETVGAAPSAGESSASWWRTSCPTSWRYQILPSAVRWRVTWSLMHPLVIAVSEGPCCCWYNHEGPGRQRRRPGGFWRVCFSGCGTIHCLWAVLSEAHEEDWKNVKWVLFVKQTGEY